MNKIYTSLLVLFLVTTGLSGHALSADSKALANTVVTAADRSPEDRALDAGRKPAELLSFLGVQPGWRIADLGAGGGYTTELLKRAVGDTGVVYGQNSKKLLEMFLEKPWSARLAKPAMKDVVRLDRDFDNPFPKETRPLDAVTMVLFYHDTVWLEVDRAAMNKAVFDALKPGGVFVIVDHSARPGDGVRKPLRSIASRKMSSNQRCRRQGSCWMVKPIFSAIRATHEIGTIRRARPGNAAAPAIGSCFDSRSLDGRLEAGGMHLFPLVARRAARLAEGVSTSTVRVPQ